MLDCYTIIRKIAHPIRRVFHRHHPVGHPHHVHHMHRHVAPTPEIVCREVGGGILGGIPIGGIVMGGLAGAAGLAGLGVVGFAGATVFGPLVSPGFVPSVPFLGTTPAENTTPPHSGIPPGGLTPITPGVEILPPGPPQSVPEPSSLALLAIPVVLLLVVQHIGKRRDRYQTTMDARHGGQHQ